MTFRQFVTNNVLRNKKLYVAYFLSSLFTVMVFFTFANFAFHPALTGEKMNANVTQGMLIAGGIIYIFSFFFILYSMSQFLQSRKKEFGVLMIQGMSTRQVRWMIFLENMLIGFFATLLGMGLGLIFSKAILLVAENVLILDNRLEFYIPTMALLITFFSFVILFFFISIFVSFVLRTSKLVTLIKGDKIGKGEPKTSIILTLLAVLLLGSGYGIALYVEGAQVITALLPVVLLVIVGTYLLFTQLSVFIIRLLKKNKNLFWKKTNMLLFSDLSYRMKDNARSFFMVAIISTVAFSSIGTLVGLNSYLTSGLRTANPISFVYHGEHEKDSIFEEVFAEHDLEVEKAEIQLNYYKLGQQSILITTPDTYNAFGRLIGEKEINLKDEEVTIVGPSKANMFGTPVDLEDKSITLKNGKEVKVDKNLIGLAKPDILPVINHYFVVSEKILNELPSEVYSNRVVGWQVIKGKQEDIVEAGRALSLEDLHVTAIDFLIQDIHSFWSPIMFVGLFIGIVFFVSAGSFLYFRLYSDIESDKEKFRAIRKIGLTTKEMKKVMSQQITLLFFAPIIVAIIHGAVALTALSNMFDYNLLYESILVLGSFLVIQVFYFVIVRYFYIQQIRIAVQ